MNAENNLCTCSHSPCVFLSMAWWRGKDCSSPSSIHQYIHLYRLRACLSSHLQPPNLRLPNIILAIVISPQLAPLHLGYFVYVLIYPTACTFINNITRRVLYPINALGLLMPQMILQHPGDSTYTEHEPSLPSSNINPIKGVHISPDTALLTPTAGLDTPTRQIFLQGSLQIHWKHVLKLPADTKRHCPVRRAKTKARWVTLRTSTTIGFLVPYGGRHGTLAQIARS